MQFPAYFFAAGRKLSHTCWQRMGETLEKYLRPASEAQRSSTGGWEEGRAS